MEESKQIKSRANWASQVKRASTEPSGFPHTWYKQIRRCSQTKRIDGTGRGATSQPKQTESTRNTMITLLSLSFSDRIMTAANVCPQHSHSSFKVGVCPHIHLLDRPSVLEVEVSPLLVEVHRDSDEPRYQYGEKLALGLPGTEHIP
jgi:hypothetical protein